MISFEENIKKALIQQYFKIIIHMHQEIRRKRFQLLFNDDIDNKFTVSNCEKSLIWRARKNKIQTTILINNKTRNKKTFLELLFQNTCLLVGFSLNDPNLKLMLSQAQKENPGTYHYFVCYEGGNEIEDKNHREKLKASNFEDYNLFLLFLSEEEFELLGNLLKMKADSFKKLIIKNFRKEINGTYLYYITGPVGVGKTTIKNLFHSFSTINEWPGTEVKPEAIKKPPDVLTKNERRMIDDWIAKQVNLKNLQLRDLENGIYIIDRCPLDAFAFTVPTKWQKKAKLLNRSLENELVEGHIILLLGDPHVMAKRALREGKTPTDESLHIQQELLKIVYPATKKSISVINTQGMTPSQIVKIIIKNVFFKKYNTFPLQKWLNNIEFGVIHANR